MQQGNASRREFIKTGSIALASTLTAGSYRRVYGANEKIADRSAGGRGRWHIGWCIVPRRWSGGDHRGV